MVLKSVDELIIMMLKHLIHLRGVRIGPLPLHDKDDVRIDAFMYSQVFYVVLFCLN